MRFQALALFAAGAAVAAPLASQEYSQGGGKDWQKIWQDQLASMKEVQDNMGKHKPTDTPNAPGYEAPKRPGYPPKPKPQPSPSPSPKAPAYPPHPPKYSPSPSPSPSTGGEGGDNSPSSGGGNGPKVTNPKAFQSGAGCKAQSPKEGGDATDHYKCYGNTASTLPSKDKWANFDALLEGNKPLMKKACSTLGYGSDNTDQQNEWIGEAIQKVAKDSLVDARFILATIMQESHGCLNVGTTNNGISNPGLMQSHAGTKFCGADKSPEEQKKSIEQMIRDGTQGTHGKPGGGDGLVQGINKYGDIYAASRMYNSGSCDPNNLNNAYSSTKTYVQTIANRMTGYVQSPPMEPTCPGETSSAAQ